MDKPSPLEIYVARIHESTLRHSRNGNSCLSVSQSLKPFALRITRDDERWICNWLLLLCKLAVENGQATDFTTVKRWNSGQVSANNTLIVYDFYLIVWFLSTRRDTTLVLLRSCNVKLLSMHRSVERGCGVINRFSLVFTFHVGVSM